MISIYTDGACSGNPGPGGCAAVVVNDKGKKIKELTYNSPQTTNNRMELMGLILALEEIKVPDDNFDTEEYTIYSDSAYAVNLVNTWMHSWERAGWRRPKNKPVENLDLVQTLYELYIQRRGIITIEKVAGHSNIYWNEVADKLAVAAKMEVM